MAMLIFTVCGSFWLEIALKVGVLRDQMLGIVGPLNIPLEEYLFFIVIPMAAIMTIEGVTTVKPHWRKDEFGK
jgi:hypothetical protein